MAGCIFCEIIRGDLPSHNIFENEYVMVFMSLENHPLIVPKKHFIDVYGLDDEHASAIMQVAVKVSRATKIATNCDGINLLQANGKAAGQDVFHFHLHIKPRFKNDSVVLSWNTSTVSEEKRRHRCQSITQHLAKYR